MKAGRLIFLLCFVAAVMTHCSPTPPSVQDEKQSESTASVTEQTEDGGTTEPLADTVPTTPDQSSPDAGDKPEAPPQQVLPRPTQGWCGRVATGPGGQRSVELDLSEAHSMIRFFGIHKGYPSIDGTLAQGLQQHEIKEPKLLLSYAQTESSICALSANVTPLPKATVTMKGKVALIVPGQGEIKLPLDTQAIAIDLRNLPAVPELTQAIEKVVGMALAKPVQRSAQTMLWHKGMKDEFFSARNVYSNAVFTKKMGSYPAQATQGLPLAFVVGEQLPPAAARIAGTLRLAQRAWLIGESIPAAVAESQWQGVGPAGLAFRTMQLSNNDVIWPDEIPSDHPISKMDSFLSNLFKMDKLSKVEASQFKRTRVKAYTHFRAYHSQQVSIANVKAALLIAHGALRMFYPYFKTVGDHIDDRLLETLKTLPSLNLTGASARNLLRRFGEAIKDGHCFVNYLGANSSVKGYLLVELDQLNKKPVIRRTSHPKLKVGDTIVSIDGTSISEWFKEEYKQTSAATPGYRFDLAARELNTMTGPRTFELQSPDGSTRTELVEPQPLQAYQTFLQQKPFRKPGFLKDLNAPDVYYVDLDGPAMKASNLSEILKQVQSAKALVLDMRGYPGSESWTLLQHIVSKPLPSPLFLTPAWKGPKERIIEESKYDLPARSPGYSGPVAYLIGPRSVSSAEHLSTMLKQVNRVTFVGRTTAGTNGNITALVLPGLLSFSFTGMEILYLDRKPFHGIGIVPDIPVAPTSKDFADGFDRTLQRAITFLQKP